MRILRMAELTRTVGLSRTTVYEMVAKGRFPAQIKLGERAVGWREDAVQQWLESRAQTVGKFVGGTETHPQNPPKS